MKYFITGAFSSAFFLYGVALLYGVSGSTSLARIAAADRPRALGRPRPSRCSGVGFLLVGFGFKVASVPFHMWAPDVYEGAPTTVTALMSAGVKAAAFGALPARLPPGRCPRLAAQWQPAVAVLAIVTMVDGQPGRPRPVEHQADAGLLVRRPRRLPAHRAWWRRRARAAEAVLFYLVAYAAVNLGGFGALAALARDGREPLSLTTWRGWRERRPAPGRGPHRVPDLAHRHPGVRRLRREVLPVQRRGGRGLRAASPSSAC